MVRQAPLRILIYFGTEDFRAYGVWFRGERESCSTHGSPPTVWDLGSRSQNYEPYARNPAMHQAACLVSVASFKDSRLRSRPSVGPWDGDVSLFASIGDTPEKDTHRPWGTVILCSWDQPYMYSRALRQCVVCSSSNPCGYLCCGYSLRVIRVQRCSPRRGVHRAQLLRGKFSLRGGEGWKSRSCE